MLKHYMKLRYESKSDSYFYEKEVEAYGIHNNQIPEGCSGAEFFDCNVITINGVELRSEKRNETGWYYVGKELSLDEAKSQGKISAEQYKRYSSFGHRKIVITKEERAIPLWAVDTVITA